MITAAAARDLVDDLIVNTGVIQATAMNGQTGSVTLYAEGSNAVKGNVAANKGRKSGTSTVEDSGVIDASGYGSGETGGTISILGDNVGILSGAIIDASGDAGGGTIKIGGDFHGQGTTPTALNTYVDANALIMANANTTGNGGNVVVWSDGNTWFLGNIIAEGGATSGNGGFVETSGHGYLDANGYVDLLALDGQKGTYLLDPATIEYLRQRHPGLRRHRRQHQPCQQPTTLARCQQPEQRTAHLRNHRHHGQRHRRLQHHHSGQQHRPCRWRARPDRRIERHLRRQHQ